VKASPAKARLPHEPGHGRAMLGEALGIICTHIYIYIYISLLLPFQLISANAVMATLARLAIWATLALAHAQPGPPQQPPQQPPQKPKPWRPVRTVPLPAHPKGVRRQPHQQGPGRNAYFDNRGFGSWCRRQERRAKEAADRAAAAANKAAGPGAYAVPAAMAPPPPAVPPAMPPPPPAGPNAMPAPRAPRSMPISKSGHAPPPWRSLLDPRRRQMVDHVAASNAAQAAVAAFSSPT